MANRTYLYASNTLPPDVSGEKLRSIGEYSWDVPFLFQLLMSANPQRCRSSIWDTPESIAIAADYEAGLEKLVTFLNRVENPVIEPMRNEAIAFLTAPENKREYLILEAGEIFELSEKPLSGECEQLMAGIENIDATAEFVLAQLNGTAKTRGVFGWLDRLLSRKRDPRHPFWEIGLGSWSNILYMQFEDTTG